MLAIDPGRVRLGLALSDPTGRVALPHATWPSRGPGADARAIAALAATVGATRIVCGLPRRLDGSEGVAAAAARRLAAAVADASGRAVELHDERFTTVAAERALVAGGERRAARRLAVDRVAAAILLQGVLGGAGRGQLVVPSGAATAGEG